MMVKKGQVICVLLGITLAAAVFFVDMLDSSGVSQGRLIRNSYGQGEKSEEVVVQGLLEDDIRIDVPVAEREYGEEEAGAAMDRAAGELFEEMAGGSAPLIDASGAPRIDGSGALRIDASGTPRADGSGAGQADERGAPQSDSSGAARADDSGMSQMNTARGIAVEEGGRLELPSWLDSYGIAVEWIPEDTDYIGTDGSIYENLCPAEGKNTRLTARMSAGAYTADYVLPVRIVPRRKDGTQQRLAGFSAVLKEADKSQSQTGYLILPDEYEGRQLTYKTKRSLDFLVFPVLGIAAAALLPLNERQKEKEKEQLRQRQMMMDYPEIVSRLVVFSGAGLPVRKAWERIVSDYEKTGERRAAYEEMAAAHHMMLRGIPELRAYAEFGRRCRSLPYRKLAGLLEQNIRNGSEGLRAVLEAEMEAAFEQKKNLARKLGEEASTKLLLPLFMMLFIVMAMVSVPAFLSFGIA